MVRGAMTAVLAGALVAGSSVAARADASTCGPSLRDACPLSGNPALSGVTPSGVFANSNYHFFARKGTQIVATVTDTEDPDCSTGPFMPCGGVAIDVLRTPGGLPLPGPSIQSSPEGGVPKSGTLRITLLAQGAYYVQVSNLNAHGRPTPFSLKMFASPKITWPHPCVVPRISHHEHLAIAKYLLPRASCRAGRVHRVRDSRVPRGDVIRFSVPRGRILVPQAKLGIYVSAG